ncbi:MAG: protein kinase, partial [Gammaproteobacteria bacterium]|nr:protein kinase [Gammaproteobacteria bacterium]
EMGRYTERPISMDEPLPAIPPLSQMLGRVRRLVITTERLSLGRVTENILKARVLYDFPFTRDDKLVIKADEVLYVWKQEGKWWVCENRAGQQGKVASNYLELLPLNNAALQGEGLIDLTSAAIRIKKSDIVLAKNEAEEEKSLGAGAYGRVCEGRYLGKVVAVKQSHASYIDESVRQDFQKEIEVMGRLRHPNIVALIAYTEDTPIPWLVMECMNRGTLLSYLGGRAEDKKHIFLPFLVVCNFHIQILGALRYLHSIGLVHRDIKTENVLLYSQSDNQEEWVAKVADFGLANFCRDEEGEGLSLKTLRSDMQVGTIQYIAPEVLGESSNRCYNKKTDMYAEGVMLWESILHEKPYHGSEFPQERSQYNRAVEKHVMNGGREKILERAAPKAWWTLTRRCWAQKPEDRPTAEEALKEMIAIRRDYQNAQSSGGSGSSGLMRLSGNRLAFTTQMGAVNGNRSSEKMSSLNFRLLSSKGKGKEKEESVNYSKQNLMGS